MSKVGPMLNGDLADGMVATMDARAIRNRDFLREDWSDKVAKVFSCDVDHMYASVNEGQTKDFEIAQLKEMLNANLDLIQTQSEAIHARDKEIAALRAENNTLRQRFQRMERRVTLQRHKDDPVTPGLPIPLGASPTPSLVEPAPSTPSPAPLSESPIPEPPVTVGKRRRASGGSASRRKFRSNSGGSEKVKRLRSVSESNESEKRVRFRPPLTTNTEYLTMVGNYDAWGPLDLNTVLADDLNKQEEVVQVPSWREKILSPLYVIEGTENVDDEVFLKRHHKLESDERRRKRWDIQRIREQTQIERLKQRVEKKRIPSRSPERIVASFYPSLEDVEEVAVGPSLPVVAFGLPLRSFDNCEFSLPWLQAGTKYLNLRSR